MDEKELKEVVNNIKPEEIIKSEVKIEHKNKNQDLLDLIELELLDLSMEIKTLDKKVGLIQYNSYTQNGSVTEEQIDVIFNDLMKIQEKVMFIIKKIVESESGEKF